MELNSSKIINLSLSLSLGLFSVLSPVHAFTQREVDQIISESLDDAVLVYCSLKENGASSERAINSANQIFMEKVKKRADFTGAELVILFDNQQFQTLYTQAFENTVISTCPEYLE